MKTKIVLILIAAAVIAVCGCITVNPTATPTANPTAQPTAQPTAAPTQKPTAVATSVPGLNNEHAYYGYVMWEQFYPSGNYRSGMWGGVQIDDAVGEVYLLTSLSDTPLRGYIRSNNEFRVDDVPVNCDVKLQKVVLYTANGGSKTVYASSDWMYFRDVAGNLRTPMDITI